MDLMGAKKALLKNSTNLITHKKNGCSVSTPYETVYTAPGS